jgi:3-hydroxybutyrate dehydrogenase
MLIVIFQNRRFGFRKIGQVVQKLQNPFLSFILLPWIEFPRSKSMDAAMPTRRPADIREPEIQREEILIIGDDDFNQDNVCLVTGAATGIGRATAIAAAANNLMTVGLDGNTAEGNKTQRKARDMGGQMIFIQTDMTKDEDIKSAVQEATKLGAIKYLANIAEIQHVDPVADFPLGKYDLRPRLMFRRPLYLSKLVIPHMKKSSDRTGVIGNLASVQAHICNRSRAVYNNIKLGLRALSQSISAEGEGNIRSFTISTGFVKTPPVPDQIPARTEQCDITPGEVVAEVVMGKSRVKEIMSLVEVGNLFVFGFSRYARYLIEGDLRFDGGLVLTYC